MNQYERYAFIREKIRILKEEMEELETRIIIRIKDLTGPMKTQYGTFTTQKRVSWKYTENIDRIKKEVLALQKKEQKEGIAEKLEKLSLKFYEIGKEPKK